MADKHVLAIIGTPGLARLVGAALDHPTLQVETAANEKEIVAALAGSPALVLVGGRVGRRGPLVLCDAVRLRNADVPVIMLLGGETDDEELAEHKGREVGRAQYLDLRDVPSSVGRAARIRNLVLAMLGVADDAVSAQNWPRMLLSAEHGNATESTSSPPAEASPPVPPPRRGPLTPEDLEFADRMVAQTRHVDLRAPSSRSPTAGAGGADRATAKLREQVRDLERKLARLAHVYRRRSKAFDTADESSERNEQLAAELAALGDQSHRERADWDRERTRLEDQISGLSERGAQAESEAREARVEAAGARNLARAEQERLAQELANTREAFRALQDESARERLRQAEEHAERLFEEVERIQQAAAEQHTEILRELDQRIQVGASSDILVRLDELEALIEGLIRSAAEAPAQRKAVQEHLDELEALVRSAADVPAQNDAVLARLDELESLARSAADVPAQSDAVLARLDELESLVRSAADAPAQNDAVLARLDELESLVRSAADAPSSVLARLHTVDTALRETGASPDGLLARLGDLEVMAHRHTELLTDLEERTRPGAEPEAPEDKPPPREITLPHIKAPSSGPANRFLRALAAPEVRVPIVSAVAVALLLGVGMGWLLSPAAPSEVPAATTAPAAPLAHRDWREDLTHDMMRAVVEKRWSDAAHLGTHLDPVFERDADALYVWADALRRSEQLEQAVTAYRRLLSQAPDHPSAPEAQLRVANLLVRLGRLEEGLEVYRAVAADPDNPFRSRAAAAVEQIASPPAASTEAAQPPDAPEE